MKIVEIQQETHSSSSLVPAMANYYDEVEIEDMTFDDKKQLYHFPCPCGDRFEITVQQLKEGDDIARCPSCSLIILVIYDQDDYLSDEDEVMNEKTQETTLFEAQPASIAA